MSEIKPFHYIADNVDALVVQSIEGVQKYGVFLKARAGSFQQIFDVQFTLLDSRDRLHLLRAPDAIRYLAREFLAYFKGSLDVQDGLSQASSYWRKVADDKGKIFSNYGYYVFYQKLDSGMTQYDWVIRTLEKNPYSRRAFININQPCHKILDCHDFPCTIGCQFYVQNQMLCCSVFSRSTDICWGLPYDIGFFSLLTELVFVQMKNKIPGLRLGFTTLKANFAQIYDRTRDKILTVFDKKIVREKMPEITDAETMLRDIYNQTAETSIMQWIYKASE